VFGLSSPLRRRLGWGRGDESALLAITDRTVMARALMYLLAGVATAVVASVVIPDGPLADEAGVAIFAGAAYAAAAAVFLGFERMPAWAVHALLLGVTALISWSVYASDEPGSAYKVFFVWVAVYASFFLGPWGAALQTAAMLAGYGVVLILLGDAGGSRALHWALTASALLLLVVAIQALRGNVMRLVERLTDIGRTDSLTGLYTATAFTEML
jgi:hypothetical protein